MEYGFKPTTNGRALIAACGALEQPLKLTRVTFGSGLVSEGTNLADQHQLVAPVADGTIGERMHENDRLYLSVQYDNSKHPEQAAFNLAEFIIYAMHPETQTETDVAYATLGDYQQPVPAYSADLRNRGGHRSGPRRGDSQRPAAAAQRRRHRNLQAGDHHSHRGLVERSGRRRG